MIAGMEPLELPSLERVIEIYETAAAIMHPCRVIGVSINSYKFSDEEVAAEREKVRRRTGLPACDVIRHGPDELVEAVLER